MAPIAASVSRKPSATAPGRGNDPSGFGEKCHTVEAGHALVGQHEGDRLRCVAFPHEHVHGFLSARRPKYPIIPSITAEQVSADSPQNLRLVIDHYYQRFTHQETAIIAEPGDRAPRQTARAPTRFARPTRSASS